MTDSLQPTVLPRVAFRSASITAMRFRSAPNAAAQGTTAPFAGAATANPDDSAVSPPRQAPV